MKHAEVRIGDYKIPLIGIPKEATLDICDLCGDTFSIRELEIVGKQLLCKKCKGKNEL